MKAKFINNLPNICTIANAICGIVALMISVFYNTFEIINIACILIAVGGFFDAIDGRLARRLKISSELGKQLDSFADLITFGITPMCVFVSLHCINNRDIITLLEILIAAFYISCAMYRLARYNISDHTNYFVGLPSTASGMFMSMYVFISNLTATMWTESQIYTYVSYTIIVLLGLAMVSTFKVKRI